MYHYHNKAFEEYLKVFPAALVCGPPPAITRLAKQTGMDFADLSDLTKRLPKSMTFVESAGLKTGEIWLRVTAGKLVV